MLRVVVFYLALVAIPSHAALTLDIAIWDRLLGQAVVDGQVDYRQWRDNPDFDRLVAQIAEQDLAQLQGDEILVFYINAYNILAAQGILEGRSPSSLFGRYLYFKRDKYDVGGNRISLHDLEHKLIRPIGEPRIHFALVCASQSCPWLQSWAYSSGELDGQLDAATRRFINDSSRNRFDVAAQEAGLSRIFDWFEEDFSAGGGTVQEYLALYVDDPEAAQLLRQNAFDVDYLDYDWGLNGSL
jgi:hypothetical protein